ncbi:unnamed protein product, partial [Staurois parvus]
FSKKKTLHTKLSQFSPALFYHRWIGDSSRKGRINEDRIKHPF